MHLSHLATAGLMRVCRLAPEVIAGCRLKLQPARNATNDVATQRKIERGIRLDGTPQCSETPGRLPHFHPACAPALCRQPWHLAARDGVAPRGCCRDIPSS